MPSMASFSESTLSVAENCGATMRDKKQSVEEEINKKKKRMSPFFVKDILGLSDESESESNDGLLESCDDDEPQVSDGGEEKMDIDSESINSKKTRQCFTNKQVEELERLFRETSYPDTYTRQTLAKKMKVSEARIQIWFQNRRAKIRRQRKQRKQVLPALYYPSSSYSWQPSYQSNYLMPLPMPLLPGSHRSERPNSLLIGHVPSSHDYVESTYRREYVTHGEGSLSPHPVYYHSPRDLSPQSPYSDLSFSSRLRSFTR